jgi:tRNA dimethylallyltransferase
MADSIVIAGATASGKTAVAVSVAQRVGGEVISMDSRQVYRGMDIGTAKPTLDERCGVPHHGFDLVSPAERFNAGAFARFASDAVRDITSRGRVPVLAGGTGFFLRALTHPLFEEPPQDPVLKERWKQYLRELPTERLREWAARLDAEGAAAVTDRQRLARLVEVAVLTGRPLSGWHRSTPPAPPAIDPQVFVLDLPRDVLTARIDQRVDAMIAAGLVDEVRTLMAAGYDERSPGMNATGYIELLPYVRGDCSLDEAVSQIRTATRQYARRQQTWFRHQLPAGAVRIDATVGLEAMADTIISRWAGENT